MLIHPNLLLMIQADALGAVHMEPDELDLEKELEKEMSQAWAGLWRFAGICVACLLQMDDDNEEEQYARQVLTETLKEKDSCTSLILNRRPRDMSYASAVSAGALGIQWTSVQCTSVQWTCDRGTGARNRNWLF